MSLPDEFIIDPTEREWNYSGHGRSTRPFDECPHCGEYDYVRAEVFWPNGILAFILSCNPSTPGYASERFRHDTEVIEVCHNCEYKTDKIVKEGGDL